MLRGAGVAHSKLTLRAEGVVCSGAGGWGSLGRSGHWAARGLSQCQRLPAKGPAAPPLAEPCPHTRAAGTPATRSGLHPTSWRGLSHGGSSPSASPGPCGVAGPSVTGRPPSCVWGGSRWALRLRPLGRDTGPADHCSARRFCKHMGHTDRYPHGQRFPSCAATQEDSCHCRAPRAGSTASL